MYVRVHGTCVCVVLHDNELSKRKGVEIVVWEDLRVGCGRKVSCV